MHELLHHGLAHAETSLVALDTDGRILAIDRIGAGWLGAEPSRIVGQGPWVFGGLIREAEWPATWSRLVDETHLAVEGAFVGPDGAVYRLSLRLSHVPPGPLRGAYAFVMATRHPMVEAPFPDTRAVASLRHASAFIDDGLGDWNVPTGEVLLNARLAALFGLEPGASTTIDAILATIPAEQRERADATRDALVRGQADRGQFLRQLARPDGSEIWLLVRLRVAARSPDGPATRIVAHVVDATALLKAEAEICEQQELFRAVAHTSTAAITVLDTDGRIVFANAFAERILGLSHSEVVGRTYDDPEWRSTALDGGPWPDEKQPFVRVMTTGEPVVDVRHGIEWPDGTRRLLSINGEPVRDRSGRIHRLVFTVHDITEATRAAELLRSREEMLRRVLDRLSVGVLVVSGDGAIQLANREAIGLMELDTVPLSQWRSHLAKWEVIDDREQPVSRRDYPLVIALTEGRPVRSRVLATRRTADAPWRWFIASAVPALDAHGRVIDVVADFIEISAQRALEQQLREARRLEAVGRLAGGIAHDFNNLLTSVMVNTELVADSLAPDHPVQVELADVLRAAIRGAALVQSLLGYARRQLRRPRMLDLDERLRSARAHLQPLLGPHITLHVDIARRLPPVSLDPGQFDQVIAALLLNARDAMAGRGELYVTGRRFDLPAHDRDWPTLSPGAYVVLGVRDTGPGVDPSVVDRIFEPFFSTKGVGRGTGLGLANCHGIARQNGGLIRLGANGPDGATFEVVLPAAGPDTDT